jgi:hypothetical protein
MTLVEATVCILILGLTAAGISALYVSGLQTLESSDDRMLLDSRLRSRMEEMIADDFDDLRTAGSGSESVTIGGDEYTLSWSVTGHDLDGDGTPEPNAMLIRVSLDTRSLSVVLVDHEDRVSKI